MTLRTIQQTVAQLNNCACKGITKQKSFEASRKYSGGGWEKWRRQNLRSAVAYNEQLAAGNSKIDATTPSEGQNVPETVESRTQMTRRR